MASSSSNSIEEEATPPPWEKLPREITAAILLKLGAVEILTTAVEVCTTWRSVSMQPSMWRYVRMEKSDVEWPHDFDDLCRRAVDLSQGQLIGITLKGSGTNDLLLYISQRSGQLKHLALVNCYDITGEGVKEAVKNLPLLENLYLNHTYIDVEAIETVGRSCPLLKFFILTSFDWRSGESDEEALAIAQNMPGLVELRIFGNRMTNVGLKAILEGCLHLKSLYMRRCHNVNFGKLCSERIKDLKLDVDSIKKYEEEMYYANDIGGVSDLGGYDDGYFDD
ncbi:hypothetical protein ABFS82_14G188300 [Erythranthe guttata]|uniref:F-box domain-containing protein n=1 Tax=Erythranthe guttata TaxID=4155 RepID=A0A022R5F0_ERYGU|nr:PREDICTED: putative F-box/LRR-repeat protein 23 [Erythranthe guttata]XP_012846308.1 PREDICTED: putative F-box/LRR-repeat protein 23 [Erythranthe guttata]EYU34863.1 hypothetical protein MIMGU_mgv1a011499mg [Erythranthe guttata]|eukprot:XP_012840445.1 PREDICTED: putative F-box/LRR-repeat protein 23 [Erythranthe guttata]